MSKCGGRFANDVSLSRQQPPTYSKATADPPPRASSNEEDFPRASDEEAIRRHDDDRPRSAPGHQVPRIGTGGNVTRSSEHKRSSEPRETYNTTNNPLKRGAGGDLSSRGQKSQGHETAIMDARPRHEDSASGRIHQYSKHPNRRSMAPGDDEHRRTTSGTKKSLWEDTDRLNSSGRGRRDDPLNFVEASPRFQYTANPPSASIGTKPLGEDWPPSQNINSDMPMGETNATHSESGKRGSDLPQDQKFQSRETSPMEELPDESQDEPEMLLQPETRPISHEQLVVEVKGIYAGLVMVEAKCIDIDERQSLAAQEKDPSKRIGLKNDQWQSLIALHKQLLHEHHDFFLASQHPSAVRTL